jgi:hypothetical protein
MKTIQYTKRNGDLITKIYDDKEYNKKYYLANKDKALEKIKCSCGSECYKNARRKHLASKKHNDYINNNLFNLFNNN